MVGSLALVGRGKWKRVDIEKALAAKDRAAGGPTAPPEGLYLVEVKYA
jgi:tRNA pseudouridine38-40 synthase